MKRIVLIATAVAAITVLTPAMSGAQLTAVFKAAVRVAPTPAPSSVVRLGSAPARTVVHPPPTTIVTRLPRQVMGPAPTAPVLPAAAVTRTSPVATSALQAFDDVAARHGRRLVADNAGDAAQASIRQGLAIPTVNLTALPPARRGAVSAAAAAAKADTVAATTMRTVQLAGALPAALVNASGAVGSTAGLKAASSALGRAANGLVPGKVAETIGAALYQARQRLAQATTIQATNVTRKRYLDKARQLAKRMARRRFDEHRRLARHYNLSVGEGRTMLFEPSGRKGTTYKWSNPAHALDDHGPAANTFDQVASRGKRTATKFTDRAVMDEAIERTMKAKKADIDKWAKSAHAGDTESFSHAVELGNLGTGHYSDPLFYDAGPALSRKAANRYREALQMRPLVIKRALKSAKVVLMSDGQGGYHLQSAYPE